ncbi:transcription termination/antitermination NusG family protein [Collinsella aerofaciens]|uniref:transcription termination/antitermination NusG family protein n=1 Tax=Collinsella aerofaciens TaxID=74426 RepID=UPI0032197662
MWYVIQVINGREDVMRERIERVVPAGVMQELFYPQYQTEIKLHREWVSTTKPLFPGYLICDTADPRTVQQYLLRMDDFARVLSQDVGLCRWQKKRPSSLAALPIGETAWCP